MNSVVCMLYRSYQSVRLRCPNSPLDSTCPFWRAKEYSLGHSSIPRWRASMREVRRQGVLRWFVMEQGLGQGWVLAPLLFNTFLTAVINVAYTRLKADIDIMDASVLFFFNLTYSRWTSYYHPTCGLQGSSHLSPVHALQFVTIIAF